MNRFTSNHRSQCLHQRSDQCIEQCIEQCIDKHRSTRRRLVGSAIAAMAAQTLCQTQAHAQWPWSRKSLTWDEINTLIDLRFPNTPKISTAQLAQWLDDGKELLILDVRQPVEFAVSQIRFARSAPKDSALQMVASLAKDTRIALYCSVGYRSAEITLKLRSLGFTQTFNCEGSIFRWANEGRPLFRGPTAARLGQPLVPPLVHPFDSFWASLLQESLRAPI